MKKKKNKIKEKEFIWWPQPTPNIRWLIDPDLLKERKFAIKNKETGEILLTYSTKDGVTNLKKENKSE